MARSRQTIDIICWNMVDGRNHKRRRMLNGNLTDFLNQSIY